MSYEETSEGYSDDRDPRARRGPQPGDSLGGRQTRLWKAAEALDYNLDGLLERLGPVLLPQRPTAALSGVGSDSPERSDLGGFLDQLTEKLTHLGQRAAELSERIDL